MGKIRAVFYLLDIAHVEKIDWIRRVIKSQLGVEYVYIDSRTFVVHIGYDSDIIEADYLRLLVQSLGCDLEVGKEAVEQRMQNARVYRKLKKCGLSMWYLIALILLFGLFTLPLWGCAMGSLLLLLIDAFVVVNYKYKENSPLLKELDAWMLLLAFLLFLTGTVFILCDLLNLWAYGCFIATILLILSVYNYRLRKMKGEVNSSIKALRS